MKEAFWLIDQFVQQGVTQFCIAPGSRNTPLVVAAKEHKQAETFVHFDERGLGFYALGWSAATQKPIAVITTSGTAVGNLLPSVMEAHHRHLPLLLLTSDRPSELRDCGANQTTDQIKVFSNFVRWQADLPPTLNETYFRSMAAQAVFHATGPVQLNCQFREPLYTPSVSLTSGTPFFFPSTQRIPKPTKVAAKRGLILMGEIDTDPRPILALAERLQWPVFADILSNARNFPTEEQIRFLDPDLKPDFILHFGSRLTSKKALQWPVTLHVSPYPFLQDPNRFLAGRIQCDLAPFCETFEAEKGDPSWLSAWKKNDALKKATQQRALQTPHPLTEADAMYTLSKILPPEAAVFLGNGRPIREADEFLFPSRCRRFFGNRGLSGIDGNIATAVGLSDGLQGPVVAFIGDQAALHDLNSFPLLKQSRFPVILILSNNFGGGIFSHLPIAEWPHFETHMAAVHSWRFQEIARMFDLPYLSFHDISFERSAVIELITSREENFKFAHDLTL